MPAVKAARKERTEAELLTLIDQKRTRARCLEIDADALDQKADVIFRSPKSTPFNKNEAAKFREQAKKKRKCASGITDTTIPNLGRRLAAVRTLPLRIAGGGGRPSCRKLN